MREKEEGRKVKEKMLKKRRRKKNATAGRTPSDFSCSFSASFRRPIKSAGKGQEGARECYEENAGPIRAEEEENEEEERERQECGVVDGGQGRKKDERWRSATGWQNLLDRREALQM